MAGRAQEAAGQEHVEMVDFIVILGEPFKSLNEGVKLSQVRGMESPRLL